MGVAATSVGKICASLFSVVRFSAGPANVINREAASPRSRLLQLEGDTNGANAMRSILVLGILIALGSSANAAKVHHPHYAAPRNVILGPGQEQAVPPGWYKFPGYPPIPPEQNRNLDPSNYGGA
jgi:hypothetical protein